MEKVFDCNSHEIEVGDVGVEIETGRPIKWDGRSFVYQDDHDDYHPNIQCAGGPGLAYYTNFSVPVADEVSAFHPPSKALAARLKKYLAQKS